ncbi:MAG: ATPase [Gammaproteobacteria bacterium]|nr:ATPase [Gammaproteobacteria bacterium]
MGRVLEDDDNGFVIESEINISALPTHVFDALGELQRWWDPEHSFGRDARNLSLNTSPDGLFLESLGTNQGVVHARVVDAQRGKLLRLSGALGPLQSLGAHGTLTLRMEPLAESTTLTLNYIVIGRNLRGWADAVEQVLSEQLIRLKSFLETGTSNPV